MNIKKSGKNKLTILLKSVFSLLLFTTGLLLWSSGNPYIPTLTEPQHQSRNFHPFPNFFWTAHPQAHQHAKEPVSYMVEIAQDAEFSKIVDTDTVFLNRYVMDKPFDPGTYYWRVRAASPGTAGKWSQTFSFTVTQTDATVTVPYKPGLPDYYDTVQKALAEAVGHSKAGRSVRLVFPKGNYRFDRKETPFISLTGVSNIIIEGSGSIAEALRFDSGLIDLKGCTNIAVMNLELDLVGEMPFSLGAVTETDTAKSTFTIKVAPGFPEYDSPHFGGKHRLILTLEPGPAGQEGRLRTAFHHMYVMRDFTKIGDRTWKLSYERFPKHNDLIGELRVGDPIIHNARGGNHVTAAINCSHVSYFRIISHASAHMQYVAGDSSHIHVLHCEARLKKGWPYSGLGDGLHMRGHRVGPWVEGCNLQALGDDSIALYTRPSTISALLPGRHEKNQLIINAEFMNFEPGDEVSFFSPKEGRILSECNVMSVKPEGGKFRVTFSSDVPQNLMTLNSDKTLTRPQISKVDQIWNRSVSTGDFVVRNNTFKNIRRYGIVARARRGVIENNTFDGCSSSAIALKNEPFWPNGLYGSEIVIISNTIIDSAFQNHAPPPLFIGFHKWDLVTPGGFEDADGQGHRDILIKDNTFINCPKPEIVIASSKNITLENNKSGKGSEARKVKAEIRNSVEVQE